MKMKQENKWRIRSVLTTEQSQLFNATLLLHRCQGQDCKIPATCNKMARELGPEKKIHCLLFDELCTAAASCRLSKPRSSGMSTLNLHRRTHEYNSGIILKCSPLKIESTHKSKAIIFPSIE